MDVDSSTLREFYRHGLLIPFVYITSRRAGPIPVPVESEPPSRGTWLTELRYARDRGRLCDLAGTPFRSRLRFEPYKPDSPSWWNGLLYSRYQLLVLPELESLLSRRRYRRRNEQIVSVLPKPHQFVLERAAKFRRIAVVLAALEARYVPKVDPEWLHLVNAEDAEWRQYRDAFDPVAMSHLLHYLAAQVRQDAEWLLVRARHLDPVGHAWSQLMRRAPRKAWKDLKDAALQALDYRQAAEILLLFYDDLAGRGEAEPLPDLPSSFRGWHPLDERLSSRPETLDQNLVTLGISPHPRVVLAVEGDTEQVHVPLVWQALGYPDAPELMRLLKLGGVDRDLKKIAALAAAPLVGGKIEGSDGWWLIKPPTRLFVAVDPEGSQFGKPEKVERTRKDIIHEIEAVLLAQGVPGAQASEIDELVKIRTWSERCYEFTHFTDEELADGIMSVHTTINGLTRDQLIDSIADERRRRKDVKEVWSQWNYKPNKVKLAHALWPTLERKIQKLKVDDQAPVPEIAEVVNEAYLVAQHWRYQSFVLNSSPIEPG